MRFKRLFVLWHPLIKSLYFIQVYILYLWQIPPHSCAFHTFCFTPIFSYVYIQEEYFFIPDDVVDRRQLET